jgi:hypothetical protein
LHVPEPNWLGDVVSHGLSAKRCPREVFAGIALSILAIKRGEDYSAASAMPEGRATSATMKSRMSPADRRQPVEAGKSAVDTKPLKSEGNSVSKGNISFAKRPKLCVACGRGEIQFPAIICLIVDTERARKVLQNSSGPHFN